MTSFSEPLMFCQDSQGQFLFVEEPGGEEGRMGISGRPLLRAPRSPTESFHDQEYTCFTIRNLRVSKAASNSSSSVSSAHARTSLEHSGAGSGPQGAKVDSFPASVPPGFSEEFDEEFGSDIPACFRSSSSSSVEISSGGCTTLSARGAQKTEENALLERGLGEKDEEEEAAVVDEEDEGILTRLYVRNTKRRASHEVLSQRGGDKAALHALLRVQQNLQHKREVGGGRGGESYHPGGKSAYADASAGYSSSPPSSSASLGEYRRALDVSSRVTSTGSLVSSSGTGRGSSQWRSSPQTKKKGLALSPTPSTSLQEEQRRLEDQLAALTDPSTKTSRVRSVACLANNLISLAPHQQLDVPPVSALVDGLRLSSLDIPESEQQVLLHQLEVVKSLALCAVREWRQLYHSEDVRVTPLSGGLSNKLYVVEVVDNETHKERNEATGKKEGAASGRAAGRAKHEGEPSEGRQTTGGSEGEATAGRGSDDHGDRARGHGGENDDAIPKKVLFRVYGHPAGTELFDPKAEQKLFKILGNIGVAPRCIAEFDVSFLFARF